VNAVVVVVLPWFVAGLVVGLVAQQMPGLRVARRSFEWFETVSFRLQVVGYGGMRSRLCSTAVPFVLEYPQVLDGLL